MSAPLITSSTTKPDDSQPVVVSVLVLLAFVAAIYVAFWTPLLDGYIVAKVGFSLIVPGLIGGTLNAIVNARR